MEISFPNLTPGHFWDSLRFWVGVFTRRRFSPYLPSPRFLARFCDSNAGRYTPHPGSSSVPALTEPSLPADAWTWTIHIVVTRPLIYQLRQWATKYRVKIKLLNMFHLFKVYVKTIKTLWTRLDKKYYLKLLRQKLHIKVILTKQPPRKQPSVIKNNRCLMDKKCFWGLSNF